MRKAAIALALVTALGCISSTTTYSIDEAGNPVVIVENHNLIRVGATAQVTTYDPEQGVIAISQVLAAEQVSEGLAKMWGRLMEVAGYALGASVISEAAGGPGTPAAVAGGIIAIIKQKVTEPDPEPEPEPGPVPEGPAP